MKGTFVVFDTANKFNEGVKNFVYSDILQEAAQFMHGVTVGTVIVTCILNMPRYSAINTIHYFSMLCRFAIHNLFLLFV
jgi:hypothetical protein